MMGINNSGAVKMGHLLWADFRCTWFWLIRVYPDLSGIIRIYPELSGIIRIYPELSGIIRIHRELILLSLLYVPPVVVWDSTNTQNDLCEL